MATEQRVRVATDNDVVVARQSGRTLAQQLGMSASEQTMVATAISELARNIVGYAGTGEVRLATLRDGERRGIEFEARDEGPGIPDLELALRDGYSTVGSLGLGLPGARRLMDEFEIEASPEQGTTVRARKWVEER